MDFLKSAEKLIQRMDLLEQQMKVVGENIELSPYQYLLFSNNITNATKFENAISEAALNTENLPYTANKCYKENNDYFYIPDFINELLDILKDSNPCFESDGKNISSILLAYIEEHGNFYHKKMYLKMYPSSDKFTDIKEAMNFKNNFNKQ